MKLTQKVDSRHRRARGGTACEYMIILLIFGLVVTAMFVVVIHPKLQAARRDRASLDLHGLAAALKRHDTKTGQYPTTSSAFAEIVRSGTLDVLLTDPWGRDYVYVNEGDAPFVLSYGADGVAGGQGHDADIVVKVVQHVAP
ncbi:General secretion pathway protein G [Myxococcus hansupus]|uniref:General secretion pathway protein G n=1 Tax=Pseudomyxococcus hansupus TaxID=1297742 RepID=A0A0H4XDQ7_9BACT|nr:type II secretion system protein GspG [Myxococcus hansupus]AKQ66182.1 General secretion pathway protein G [Myxococcus hansupus]